MRNIHKSILYFFFAALFLFSSNSAFAHVVVKPNEVGAAAYQTFTVGVPNEKNMPTVGLRLVIPDGLKSVTPNVKQGWTIEVKKTGEGEDAKVTEISWSGGEVPAGQRDDFLFSAQAPANETTLQWKAYQTYEGGEVVAWDQTPASHDDHDVKPYSETKVVNDLADSHSNESQHPAASTSDNLPTILSIAAVIMSTGALFLQARKKK